MSPSQQDKYACPVCGTKSSSDKVGTLCRVCKKGKIERTRPGNAGGATQAQQ